jgi:hypothetical protein
MEIPRIVPRASIASFGPSPFPRQPVRLICLLAVRDGIQFLPGFIGNVAPHVDGIVAVDDGSRDGSAEFLSGRPEVLELVCVPPERPSWDEMGNHRALVAAATRHDADWALCLDVDERVERTFRERAERVIRRGRLLGCTAFAVRLRELWDAPDQFRVDGPWGRKSRARLFEIRPDHEFDTAPLHGIKAPLQARPYRLADLCIYHLGMLTPAERAARRARYEEADPDARWQAIGYAHLTDERGLRLRRVPQRRAWAE